MMRFVHGVVYAAAALLMLVLGYAWMLHVGLNIGVLQRDHLPSASEACRLLHTNPQAMRLVRAEPRALLPKGCKP